ncbi:hypothetical protein J2755_001199 [Methanohalophilus levihalophilus]|uniref:hypothetical protein n=1 Tax=Methanohalophilus levihalophilus TaxID=1431282 RepID=UPI001AE6C099|nr:hypothetical protein [Methanohalophilus levihalophilus]MBP2030265.1 hypothetical protein [Methanohalophilus levihalophilus]
MEFLESIEFSQHEFANDFVSNPWGAREGVAIIDVETDFGDIRSMKSKRERKFRCGVIYSYDQKNMQVFKKPTDFVSEIKKHKHIVSYNGEGFDFFVLEKYGLELVKKSHKKKLKIPEKELLENSLLRLNLDRKGCRKPVDFDSYDLLSAIVALRPYGNNKKWPSLEEMMQTHYNCKKENINLKRATLKQLIKHCIEDVEYLKRLYEEKTWIVPVIPRWGLPLFTDPTILNDPTLPKPLHGLNPRTVKGKEWWDKKRRLAYIENNQCCWACGISRYEVLGENKWLEAHEIFDIDYAEGRGELKKIVALCPYCHNYIHSGRLQMLVEDGKVAEESAEKIISYGNSVLKKAGFEILSDGEKILRKMGIAEYVLESAHPYEIDDPINIGDWEWLTKFAGNDIDSYLIKNWAEEQKYELDGSNIITNTNGDKYLLPIRCQAFESVCKLSTRKHYVVPPRKKVIDGKNYWRFGSQPFNGYFIYTSQKIESAEWKLWHIVIDGQVYRTAFKNYEDWKKHYSDNSSETDR